MGRGVPLGGLFEGGDGALGEEGVGGGDADELVVAGDDDAVDGFGGGEIDVGEGCAEGGGAEDFAVEHAGENLIRWIFVLADDDIRGIGAGEGRAEDFPFADGADGDVARDGLLGGVEKIFVGGEVGVGEFFAGGGFGGEIVEEFFGGGAPLADGGDGGGRGSAADGGAVVGAEFGVGEDEFDLRSGNAEFLGGGLRDLGACALAAFDFAGEDGDGAVGGDVESGVELDGCASAEATAATTTAIWAWGFFAGLLRESGVGGGEDQDPRAENLDEGSAGEAEVVTEGFEGFFELVDVGDPRIAIRGLWGGFDGWWFGWTWFMPLPVRWRGGWRG